MSLSDNNDSNISETGFLASPDYLLPPPREDLERLDLEPERLDLERELELDRERCVVCEPRWRL